jgi:hypothetical protein
MRIIRATFGHIAAITASLLLACAQTTVIPMEEIEAEAGQTFRARGHWDITTAGGVRYRAETFAVTDSTLVIIDGKRVRTANSGVHGSLTSEYEEVPLPLTLALDEVVGVSHVRVTAGSTAAGIAIATVVTLVVFLVIINGQDETIALD